MSSWYVVQTVGGREARALDLLEKLVDPSLVEEAFVPRAEAMRRIKGQWVRRAEPMLPGYLFVVTARPDALERELRSEVTQFARVLKSGGAFSPLPAEDAAFVEALTEPGDRVVAMSTGVIEGDEVVVLSGPLVGHAGMIERVDRHKRAAYLGIEILGRRKSVRVGLEIVRKRSGTIE